jgi:hypothetical protein
MRWLSRFYLISLASDPPKLPKSPSDYNRSMGSKPSVAAIVMCAVLAAASMSAAVYFGGTGRTPLALGGTLLFVMLGGLAFELARRRSV